MNGRCSRLLFLAGILCVPGALPAQETEDVAEITCPDIPMTTHEMRDCAWLDLQAAEEELSLVSDSVRGRQPAPERFDSLQAVWIVQRDSTCVEETEEWTNGTGRPQMEMSCRTRLTEEYVARLRAGGVPE